ncbi:MAG: DUF521 domain-containing protein, partial [Rhodospirillaceae bacterium]|nr:DUF521 domain-containing protein [Rhodospirillaceae bacterium]
MQLTRQQQGLLDGDGGPACQWAMQFNHDLGNFFGAEQMVPVASAHFAPDTGMAGDPGKKLLAFLESHQARVVVPAYLDPCSVDIGRAAEWMATYGVSETFIAADRETQRHCRALGFRPTYTCINYQTIEAPKRGDHLAWGDTGAAIAANAMFGARTNFEGGPSALASALIGCTPAYGMHLPGNRRGNLSVRITCAPEEIADWGALAAIAGTLSVGYDTVLVFHGDFAPPSFDMLKQFAVALASYGGHAMFHLAGVTPEAATLEAAFGGTVPGEEHVVTRQDLDAVFERSTMADNSVDLVVFAAPQL